MSSIINALTSGGGIALTGDTSGQLQLQTNNGTTAVTIDTSQNVGIGTTTPSSIGKLGVYGGNLGIQLGSNTTGTIDFYNINTTKINQIKYDDSDGSLTIGSVTGGAYPTKFQIAGTERMRITSSGQIFAGTTSGSEQLIVTGSYAGANTIKFENTSATGYGITCLVNNNSSNTYRFFEGVGSGPTQRIVIFTNGDVKNTNNSYGAISDLKLKQDIVDASSQWNDIKNLRVRKYRLKDDPEANLQIGLVAQEAELISAGLVSESPDEERDENGNVIGFTGEYTKSIKYSVLYMKAVKALQEAMERIEKSEALITKLQADVAALKGVK